MWILMIQFAKAWIEQTFEWRISQTLTDCLSLGTDHLFLGLDKHHQSIGYLAFELMLEITPLAVLVSKLSNSDWIYNTGIEQTLYSGRKKFPNRTKWYTAEG
jgi:hypothetical protein